MAIFASLPSASNVAFAHWPISSPALKLSVAKVASAASAGSGSVSSAMTRRPGLARLVDRRDDGARVVRRDQDALRAGPDQALDGRDLALVVAVLLAGEGLDLGAELGRLALCALLHLHEERVGLRLGDQADLDVLPTSAAVTPTAAFVVAATGDDTESERRCSTQGRDSHGTSTTSRLSSWVLVARLAPLKPGELVSERFLRIVAIEPRDCQVRIAEYAGDSTKPAWV